ncbi:MAG: hypothetical protein FJ150_00835 [Euryarchaeota archaeon]|nr:hypothetical protein [Euryarchaeota archaeon]
MALIAQNHLQFIIEVALFLFVGIMFLINIAPLSLSIVLFISLVLSVGFTMMFGVDAFLLFSSITHYEFTHPFGPIALLACVTALSALPMMKEAGIDIRHLKIFVILLIIIITVVGSLMHRSFLILWFLGLLIGSFIISKSFHQKSVFTLKRIILLAILGISSFAALEYLSRFLDMPILSPLLRISRLEEFSIPSIQMVLKNATLFGHNQGSCYWGPDCLGGSDGYISMPMSLILLFGLPYPLFYGILVTKKDVIDYMMPGIFGFTFDFGYISLIVLLIWCLAIFYIGFRILAIYSKKRENGDRNYLGREALLIGSLSAFITQAIVGLFIINRSINGTALLTFIFLGAMVVGHVILMRKD